MGRNCPIFLLQSFAECQLSGRLLRLSVILRNSTGNRLTYPKARRIELFGIGCRLCTGLLKKAVSCSALLMVLSDFPSIVDCTSAIYSDRLCTSLLKMTAASGVRSVTAKATSRPSRSTASLVARIGKIIGSIQFMERRSSCLYKW